MRQFAGLTLPAIDVNMSNLCKVMTLIEILKAKGKEDPEIIAAKINGQPADLNTPVTEGTEIEWINISSPDGLEVLRHSTSHLMAQAVKELYPEVRVTIGPAIEDGFYYDFDYEKTFTPDDLVRIEKRMRELAEKNMAVVRMEMSKEDAIKLFDNMGENYKVEIISEIPDKTVSC